MTWLQDRRLSNLVESRQVGYANIHRYKSATFSEIAHAFVYHRIPCVIVCLYLSIVIMQCTLQWIDIFIVFIFNPYNELLQLATLPYDPPSLPDYPYITTFITTFAPTAGLASEFRSKSISDIPSNFAPSNLTEHPLLANPLRRRFLRWFGGRWLRSTASAIANRFPSRQFIPGPTRSFC
jgi:hypothetical protein